MDSCLVIRDTRNKKGFIKANNSWALRTDLSSELKNIMINIFGRSNMPNNKILNWNQKTIRNITKLGRYEVESVIKEAVKYGFCYCEMSYPHAPVDGEIIMNNRIQYIYHWYEDPSLNPHFNKGAEEMVSSENNIKEIKDFIEKVPEIQKSIEVEEPIVVDGNILDNPYYNLALEDWKSSYYMDHINGKDLFVDIDDSIREYIKENLSTNDDINRLSEGCWNVLVKAVTYNNSAFNSYRYSTAGNRMAEINKKAIMQAYNTFDTYQQGLSKIDMINAETTGAKRFLIHSTMVIHNYIKLGFLDGKLPEFKELLGLYKVLTEYPELICLKNNKESYKILDYLFNVNQEQYNRRT